MGEEYYFAKDYAKALKWVPSLIVSFTHYCSHWDHMSCWYGILLEAYLRCSQYLDLIKVQALESINSISIKESKADMISQLLE